MDGLILQERLIIVWNHRCLQSCRGQIGKRKMEKRYDEQVVQRFPYRCPYCDDPIEYGHLDLKIGENFIRCPSCHRTFIKIIPDSKEGAESL